MRHKLIAVCGVMALSASSMFADFSYHESTKITGGVMAGMMKVAGAFSKQAREPMESDVAVKGNRMARRSATHLNLIDLDSKTITDVDLQKKTYSVLTFDEMKQAMENLANKMNQKKDADMKLQVSADATGKTRQIAGFDAKEMLLKVTMQTTDQKSGQTVNMNVLTSIWIAANVPGYAEVSAFHKKMAEQLNWAPGNNMFMGQPDVAKGMSEAYKEISKLNGTPVLQTVVMGPEGIAPPSSDAPPAAQQEQPKPKPSVGGMLGGALGGRLGRKKSEPAPQEQTPSQQPQNGGVLVEMQTEYSAFGTTADASLFDIPSGFKQVESEMKKFK